MSQAGRMTTDQARRFLDQKDRTHQDEPCEYGHLGCSTTELGPCLDEVLHLFPQLEEEA